MQGLANAVPGMEFSPIRTYSYLNQSFVEGNWMSSAANPKISIEQTTGTIQEESTENQSSWGDTALKVTGVAVLLSGLYWIRRYLTLDYHADEEFKKAIINNKANFMLPLNKLKAAANKLTLSQVLGLNERPFLFNRMIMSLGNRFLKANKEQALTSIAKGSKWGTTSEAELIERPATKRDIPYKIGYNIEKGSVAEKLENCVAVKSMRGDRPQMEDTYLAMILKIKMGADEVEVPLFGVFDGHGGDACAKFLEANLPSYLEAKLEKIFKTIQENSRKHALISTLKTTFVELGRKFRNEQLEKGIPPKSIAGSTACIALQIGSELYVANVGDSRAIVCQNKEDEPVIGLTVDANIPNAQVKSILKRGGQITAKGDLNNDFRVAGDEVNLRRAVGHAEETGINPRAEVTLVDLNQLEGKQPVLIIACDGFFDRASSTDAAKKLNELKSKEGASLDDITNKMVTRAFNAGSDDNITFLAVDLALLDKKPIPLPQPLSVEALTQLNMREFATKEEMQRSLDKQFRQANTKEQLTSHAKVYREAEGVWAKLSVELKKEEDSSLQMNEEIKKRKMPISKTISGILEGSKISTLNGQMVQVTMLGGRIQNEDFSLAVSLDVKGVKVPLFGVFDGHGGESCAEFLNGRLSEFLKEKLIPILDGPPEGQELAIVNMLKIAFVELNEKYRKEKNEVKDESTACITIILNDKIYTANVGDTRAVLSMDDIKMPAIALSKDANSLENKLGVEKRGGRIIESESSWKVTHNRGTIETPRAIGDFNMPGINSRSQVTVFPLSQIKDAKSPILTIASDGLWDFVSSNEFSRTIQTMRKENDSLEDISKKVLAKVWNTGKSENTTLLMIDLSPKTIEE